MAIAVYADVVSTLSGALTKINKKSPHAVDQKMVLATHRTAPTTQVGKCNRHAPHQVRSRFGSSECAFERFDQASGRPRIFQCAEEHGRRQDDYAQLHLVPRVRRVRPKQRLIA